MPSHIRALSLPAEWEATSVVRHLDSPYSEEALAEPVKSWIEVGNIDFSTVPHVGLHSLHENNYAIKECNDDINLSIGSQLEGLHLMFTGAAKTVLGLERFNRSQIYFTHWSSDLSPGQHFTVTTPHLDGGLPAQDADYSVLRLIGVAFNAVPTVVLQGELTRDDFRNGSELDPVVLDQERLTEAELPLSKLVIMSPATLHHARKARERVPIRHFMRWQLWF